MENISLYKRSARRAVLHLWSLFVISFLAIKLKLYDIFWWFDRPMHFYGGYVSALLIIALLFKAKILFVGVFLVGVAWELFELFVENNTGTDLVSMMDSIEDLIFDMSGSVLAYYFYFIDQREEQKISKIS